MLPMGSIFFPFMIAPFTTEFSQHGNMLYSSKVDTIVSYFAANKKYAKYERFTLFGHMSQNCTHHGLLVYMQN